MTQATISPPLAEIDVLDLLNQALRIINEIDHHQGEQSHLGDAYNALSVAVVALNSHLSADPRSADPPEDDAIDLSDYDDIPW